MTYFDAPAPRVFGHRGAAGVAPENTLPSFAAAVALGANYLELDVHATSDGALVILHDATLDRTTDGEGPVRQHTFEAVSRLDAGYRFTYEGRLFPFRGQGVRVPLLETLLRLYPDFRFNIEIKQESPPIVEAVVDLLGRTGTADRTLLAAENDTTMRAIRAAVGDRVATGMSAGDVAEFIGRCRSGDWSDYKPLGRAMQIPPRFRDVELVTPQTIAAAHRLGIEVHVWTINDAAEIERLLDLGVDGIMSDLPGLAAVAAARRGR